MMNQLGRLLTIVLLCFFCSAVAAVQRIDSVRMSHSPDATRLVFDLQKRLEYKVIKLENPIRIVVDMASTDLQFDFAGLNLTPTPINQIRTGKQSDNSARVVFELERAQRLRTMIMEPSGEGGWRLVVDLYDDLDPEAPVIVQAKKNLPKSPLGQTLPDGRPMVIALDPGHGGQDPGAIGPSGTREKDVVLEIAKRLAKHINQESGMRAVLIRTGDYYVPLVDRRRIASEKHGADVFLSIHADAFTDPRAHGASIFALSTHGSTSAKASYLARIANDSDRVAGVFSEERNNDSLLDVIADLTTTGALTQSMTAGGIILEELSHVTKLHGNRLKVEQAGFAVLKEPKMMSLLLETGFISNRQEEKKLRSSAHQEKMAQAVVRGLNRYFEMHPQPETYYAMLRRRGGSSASTHRISSGETLSSIARRYQVTENALRQHNNISGDKIRTGQTLKIPSS